MDYVIRRAQGSCHVFLLIYSTMEHLNNSVVLMEYFSELISQNPNVWGQGNDHCWKLFANISHNRAYSLLNFVTCFILVEAL